MSDVFKFTLQPNTTYGFRELEYMRVISNDLLGILCLTEKRGTAPGSKTTISRYAVKEFPSPLGRAFRLIKPENDGECYNTLISFAGSFQDQCDCTGFLQCQRCKHVESLRAILAANIFPPTPPI